MNENPVKETKTFVIPVQFYLAHDANGNLNIEPEEVIRDLEQLQQADLDGDKKLKGDELRRIYLSQDQSSRRPPEQWHWTPACKKIYELVYLTSLREIDAEILEIDLERNKIVFNGKCTFNKTNTGVLEIREGRFEAEIKFWEAGKGSPQVEGSTRKG